MRTPLLSTGACLLLLGAAGGFAPRPDSGQATPARLMHPVVDASCKPSGPLAVELAAASRHADGSVELEFSIRPVLPMKEVEWRIEVPDGLLLLEGAASGRARIERDALTSGRARVLVPELLDRTAVRLVVTGVFLGADELGLRVDERVQVVRSVSWGEHAPVGRVVTQLDPRSGRSESMVVLPSHERAPEPERSADRPTRRRER